MTKNTRLLCGAALVLAALCGAGAAGARVNAPERCSTVDQVGGWSVRVVAARAGRSILLARVEAGAAVEFRRDGTGGLSESLILLATGDHMLRPGEDGYRLVVDIDGRPIVAEGRMPRGARAYPALIPVARDDGMRLLRGFRAGREMRLTAQTIGADGAVRAVVARRRLDLAGSAEALLAAQTTGASLAAQRSAGICP